MVVKKTSFFTTPNIFKIKNKGHVTIVRCPF